MTPSAERRVNIAAAICGEPAGDFFRFAVVADISSESYFRQPVWQTTSGEARAIIAS